jgi:ABC-type nitrate/sulfonate/bicarbonate transport system permease component
MASVPLQRPASPRRATTGRRASVPPIWGLAPLVLALVLWQLLGPEQSVYAPKPSRWIERITAMWTSGELQQALIESLTTFLLGLLISTVLGIGIGALVGRSRIIDRALGPLFEFFRVMPPAAMVPIAVLIAGYSENMKVAIVVISAIWPILLQVRSAAKGIDPLVFDVAAVLRLSRWDRTRKLLLPSLVPAILQGVRVATPTILIIVLLVEIVTRINGVGGLMNESQANFDSAGVYGLLILTGILALLVNLTVSLIEKWLLRYRPH